jgi:sec-independent protein translocase protein TatA
MELGMGELIVILVIVLLIFGASRLPALGEGLGKAIRGFKDNVREDRKSGPSPAKPPAAALPSAPDTQPRDPDRP